MEIWSAKEAHDAWQAGQAAILDIREQREHDVTRVPGVPLIPMSELVDRLDEVPDQRPLIVLCRSGARSARVAEFLEASGEPGEVVANLEGGIIAWAAEGLPYEGDVPS